MTTTPAPTPAGNSNNAAAAYAARRGDIARLLDVLDLELAKHAEAAKADPRNWGRVGDLATVRGGLVGIVAAISNMDPAEVEAFLNDAI